MKIKFYKSQALLNDYFNVVNYLKFKKDKLAFLAEVAGQDARAVKFCVGQERLVFIKQPADIRELLLLDNKVLDKSTPAYDGLRKYLGNGLLSSKKKDWSKQRKIANPFFQPQKINDYFPKFKDITRSKIKSALEGETEKNHNLNLWISDITLSILGETILGIGLKEQTVDISKSLDKIFDTTIKEMYHPVPAIQNIKLIFSSPYNKAKASLKKVILSLIMKNNEKSLRNNYISHLIDYQGDANTKLSSQQVFDEIITMIQAGHETSSNALIWTLIHLQNSESAKIKLLEELKSLPENYTLLDLDSLEFLNACILESMRLDPPAWAFDRRVLADLEINGLQFKKNDIIVFSPYFTHRIESFWSNPNDFSPERFLGKNLSINDAYFPFGFGPRFCIGQRFALIELKTILAEIFLNVNIKILSTNDIKREGSITLRPNRDVFFEI